MICRNCGAQLTEAMPVCQSCGKDFRVDNKISGNLVPQTPTPEPGRPLPKPFAEVEEPSEKPKAYSPVSLTDSQLSSAKPQQPAREVGEKSETRAKPTLPSEALFARRKRNWFFATLAIVVILVVFLCGGVWALDELVPGFLPFRLYDFVSGRQQITDFLPEKTAAFLTLRLGSVGKVSKLNQSLAKLPGGQKVETGIYELLRGKEIEEFLGISFKRDLSLLLGEEVYLAFFSFKTGPENDLVLALTIKNEPGLTSMLDKIRMKLANKVVEQEKLGVKYWIVDMSSAGRVGQIVGKTYQFKLGNYWFITTNERNLIEILKVRDNQKLSKKFFGNIVRLTTNPLYGKVWSFYQLQNWFAFVYISGDRLFEVNIPQFGWFDRMLTLATKDSALGLSLSAEEEGLRFSYRYFTGQSGNLSGPKPFDPSARLAKYFPQKFMGAPAAIYYEAASLQAEIENAEKSFPESAEVFRSLGEILGIDVKTKLVPLFSGGWGGMISVPEESVNPQIAVIVDIDDAQKFYDLFEEIKSESKLKWRKTRSNGVVIYTSKPAELQGLSVAVAAKSDKLYLASSLKGLKELMNFKPENGLALANDATFLAQYQKVERRVHSNLYISPQGLYHLVKLYLGSRISDDADLVLSSYAKALSSFGLVNFSERDRVGADAFLRLEELSSQEKQEAAEALERILIGVSPSPTLTPTP